MPMINTQEAYLKNVQATYRYFCYHVHNDGKDVTKEGYRWYPSPFHMFLCDKVQEFIEKDSDFPSGEFLILNTPPQVGKSTTITETLPAWYKMRYPDKGVIVISYGDDLASRFGRANLDKIKRYGKLFGLSINKKKATAQEIELLNHKGQLISRGLKSPLTGYTGNLILIDDPIKNRQDADSETKRNALWEEFNDSISTRLNNGDKLILIMTRWHEDDLAARIMSEYPERTTVINVPCEADSEDDPLGRAIGDPICPEIGRDKEWVEDKKSTVTSEEGSRTWNALYQGRPSAREGNILKREWWQYYNVSDYYDGTLKFDLMLMSVDATFKDGKKNDYVAIEVWGKKGANSYLVDLINEHLDIVATMAAIRQMQAKHRRLSATLIEDAANGTALITMLRNELPGLIGVTPDKSKEARVNAVAPYIEAKNVYLPRDKDFTWEFIDQASSFPNGKHDDMVDSASQALARLRYARTARHLRKETKTGDKYFDVPVISKRSGVGKGDKIRVI